MSQTSQSSIRRTRPMAAARPAASGDDEVLVPRPGQILAQLILVLGIGSLFIGGCLLFGTMLSPKTTAGRWTEHALSIGLNPFSASISGVLLLALSWLLREVQFSRAHAVTLDQQNFVLSRQNEELYRKIVEIRNQDKGLLLDRIYNLMESLRGESQQTSQAATLQHALVEEIHNLVTQQGPHLAQVAQSSRHSLEHLERLDSTFGTLRSSIRQAIEQSDTGEDLNQLRQLLGESLTKLGERVGKQSEKIEALSELRQLLGESLSKLNDRFGKQSKKIDALSERFDVEALVQSFTRSLPDPAAPVQALSAKLDELRSALETYRRETPQRPAGGTSSPALAVASTNAEAAPAASDAAPASVSSHEPAPRANSQHFRNALTKLKNLRDQKAGNSR